MMIGDMIKYCELSSAPLKNSLAMKINIGVSSPTIIPKANFPSLRYEDLVAILSCRIEYFSTVTPQRALAN
ncbi:hypothetical protein GCM10010991_01070 [Gemmobacter aquaticus]|uniref:Uncharacterized protein n=1 Tax=Gemmobacter aquaticus TaxID=490185 RepID=A0A918DBR9_9RHOB|nr:hypothetical protein GCM10010991_01070 [Gemmobacter aquaticus]